MKKVGLVSVRNYNYGSILQAYALQQELFAAGIDNELIYYKKRNVVKQALRIFNLPLLMAKTKDVWRVIEGKTNPKLKPIISGKVFYNRCALRPSCYECPYATTERKTDMTIGDFWHIEETIPDFYDPDGNSLFLIHTNRGDELFKKIQGDLDYRLSNTTQCWQANLEASTKKSQRREEFWNDYQRKGIDFVMKKYGTVPMKTKIKNKLLRIIGGGYTESSTCYADHSERRAA